MTTKPQSATEPPDRIWIQPAGLSFFYANSNGTYYSTPDIESIEYARVDRKYFCSCGGALTAEEYIIHYFEMGHDRGDPAFTASAAPVVDDNLVSDVDRWKRDLIAAGWAAKSATAWQAPDGGLWRGPFGAWKELQRREKASGTDTNWPLCDVLTQLIEWAKHLHDDHDCDCHGWEARSFLIEAANRYAAATAAPVEHTSIPLVGYERAITLEWEKHNARRHELIEAKRSRPLSDEEVSELRELQWLAGIKRELLTGPVPVKQADELVDEVQHRMDQVVEAAVEWHQAGREGGEWLEAAEKLGAAIDSLLELRGDPQTQI